MAHQVDLDTAGAVLRQPAAPRWLIWACAVAAVGAAGVAVWSMRPWPVEVAYMVMLVVVIAAAMIDAQRLELPDRITYPVLAAGVVVLVAFQISGTYRGLWPGLIGGAVYGGILLVAGLVSEKTYALGDIKLAAGLGVWLGGASVDALVAGFVCGQLLLLLWVLADRLAHRQPRAIPAGPALVAGAIVGLLLN